MHVAGRRRRARVLDAVNHNNEVAQGRAERLFRIASDKRTRESNRKYLYMLQQRVEAVSGTVAAGTLAVAVRGMGEVSSVDPDIGQVQALRRLMGGKGGDGKITSRKPASAAATKPRRMRPTQPEAKAVANVALVEGGAEVSGTPVVRGAKNTKRSGKLGKATAVVRGI